MSGFNYSHNGLTFLSSPGAWMYDDSTHAWPIFNSGDLTDVTNSIYKHNGSHPPLNNLDDAWAVLPGFKLEVFFDTGYGGSKYTLDNTDGATYLTKKNEDINSSFERNKISSVRLYYKGTELKTIAPNFAISGAHSIIQGSTYSFIYILGDTSFNYSGSESELTDISMLIVGGGGSGGRDHGYSGAGGGGGGEVGIGSITITKDQDYSIYIGDGGTYRTLNSTLSHLNSYTEIRYGTQLYIAYGGGQGAGDHSAGTSTEFLNGIGSGGGGSGYTTNPNRQPGGSGRQIETIIGNSNLTSYTNNGGNGYWNWGGGGGGGAGSNGSTTNQWRGGSGGNGIQWLDSSGGDGRYYGGGGAGIRDDGNTDTSPKGGKGGGGGMSSNGYDTNYSFWGSNGAPNTGGGGSGRQGGVHSSWAGGSGVVVFRVTNAQLDS